MAATHESDVYTLLKRCQYVSLKIAVKRSVYVHGSPARAAARAITAPSGGHAALVLITNTPPSWKRSLAARSDHLAVLVNF